jgi:membrane-bound lytic murein transglycosylase D
MNTDSKGFGMRKCMKLGLVGLLGLYLSACAHHKKTADDLNADTADKSVEINENESSSETVEKSQELPYVSPMGEVPLDDNANVQKWVHYFQHKGRKYMNVYLARSTRYLPMMKNTLRENGLPEDLVYVSLIESGFSGVAHSHSNAVGYWQFMRATGKRYGLHVDGFIDERRDPVLSTKAAAEYFKELYSLFGSWHLSLAAYNAGENRVKRAVMKNYTRDFWELMKKRRSLAAETKQYVPKFIAAAMIAKAPEKYGFTEIEFEDPLSFDTVALTNPISMNKLSQNLNVDVEELKLLNPKFRGDFIPMTRNGETVVRIPVGKGTDAVAAVSLSVSAEPKIVQAEMYYYRVRSGDNLSSIAKHHHTTVSRLRRENDLSNRVLLRVGMKLRVPDAGGEGYHYANEGDAPKKGRKNASIQPAVATAEGADSAAPGDEFHVVRRGENLSTISKKFGVTVPELLKLNNLGKKGTLRAGQKLRLHDDAGEKSAVLKDGQHIKVSKKLQVVKHKITRGETLAAIAAKYKVKIEKLAQMNNLKPTHRVVAGQSLIVPSF